MGPGPHIQQYPLPATGTCDEAQPEGLNWGESWLWWMDGGEGGEVCTRTLASNASTAAWEIGEQLLGNPLRRTLGRADRARLFDMPLTLWDTPARLFA